MANWGRGPQRLGLELERLVDFASPPRTPNAGTNSLSTCAALAPAPAGRSPGKFPARARTPDQPEPCVPTGQVSGRLAPVADAAGWLKASAQLGTLGKLPPRWTVVAPPQPR